MKDLSAKSVKRAMQDLGAIAGEIYEENKLRGSNQEYNPKHSLRKPANKPRLPSNFRLSQKGTQLFQSVERKAPFIFLTGKAGTGKSTFIQYVRQNFEGNLAVVAPTGVAALNVGGQTIHSLFKFPPKPFDDSEIRPQRTDLFKKLDLLIIDEISMVRADLMDHIDFALRYWRQDSSSFGGLQILVVGDLFQLPPVIGSNAEREYFSSHYKTSWFFGANVFNKNLPVLAIEFDEIYRQKDEEFIEGLNRIRVNNQHRSFVARLNNACFLEKSGRVNQLILTATNNQADSYNNKKFLAIDSPSRTYSALKEGYFSLEQRSLPALEILELKIGTQVMVTKNIMGAVNGTIGDVVHMGNEVVTIRRHSDSTEVPIERVKWEQYSFQYDEQKKKVVSKIIGTYCQIPLRLGWAVTIHKSQGLTLDDVFIDLGNGAFTAGQTYVALSRCRSINNIKLAKPIRMSDVQADEEVIRFYKKLFS